MASTYSLNTFFRKYKTSSAPFLADSVETINLTVAKIHSYVNNSEISFR